MDKEQLRMQMLAGVITESEYTAVINKEIEDEDKASLNESMIGGIVGIGSINQIPATPKTDYEMAFEHFLGERYEVKLNRERDDITDIKEDETSDMEAEVEDEISMNEEVSEGYSDEEVSEIGKNYEQFRKYIKNLDYDDLMEYAELSQEFKTLDILTYLKEKSKFL